MVAAAGCLALPAYSIIVAIIILPEAQRSRSEAEAAHKSCRACAAPPCALSTKNAGGDLGILRGAGAGKQKAEAVRVAPMASASRFNHRWQSRTSPFDCTDDPSRERVSCNAGGDDSLPRRAAKPLSWQGGNPRCIPLKTR